MKKQIIITEYSYFKTKDYFVDDEGTRLASIFSKMIEIAARKCDHYSSDIYYDMKALEDATENEEWFDRILVFRENGVYSYKTADLKENPDLFYNIQDDKNIWRLEHKLKLNEYNRPVWITTLTRVNVKISQSLN